ncbi:hypothetical protein B484DRAFT_411409, partial [Ochromonadaceae sp. CCMP2298]
MNDTIREVFNRHEVAARATAEKAAAEEVAKAAAEKAAAGTAAAEKAAAQEQIALSEQIAQADKRGSKPWGRSKIMIVGEGRAGKSALANSIIGRPFSQTESTVGINQLTCDIKYAAVGGGEWGEFVKPER